MRVFARFNHIGRVHLWLSREAYESGEASAHWLDPRIDPRWLEAPPSAEAMTRMRAGELVEIEDPGFFEAGAD